MSATLVVIGSSTAEGVGATPGNGWVERYRRWLLAERPGWEVVNLACGGYTTWHLLPDDHPRRDDRPAPNPRRNVTRALAAHPSALLLNLLTNDTASGWPVDETLANHRAIVARAAAAGVPMWVTTPKPRALDAAGRAALAALRDGIAAAFAPRVIDCWSGLALADGSPDPRFDCGDGVHPNDAGHAALCERVIAGDPCAAAGVMRA